MNRGLTISEIADKVGVTSKTLIRWEKLGKIKKPKRDWKGWRVYQDNDLQDILRMVNAFYEIDRQSEDARQETFTEPEF